jgi:Mg-chelatase subunit ChlD
MERRQTDECGSYDPRVRPWYIAASSGPKNVIMILDTSGWMAGPRIELLKAAAKRVVQTLTVSDRIAIVTFSTDASLIADSDGTFYRATAENKEVLMKRIDDRLHAPKGQTNFLAAFKKAFQVFEKSKEEENHVDCNSAIMFLTDGKLTIPVPSEWNEALVIDEIRTQLEHIREI